MIQKMPPFHSLLKSRDVEDPINLWVHRPLAYLFSWLVFRTPITPNMVTFLAMGVGMIAGALFIVGTKTAMIAGGILLWTSAILDGADGILARAKNMQSDFGRAIDGTSDMVVAVFTVLPAVYHIWMKHHDVVQIIVSVPIILLTTYHLSCYDYYKESYLRMTRLDRGGEGSDVDQMVKRLDEAKTLGRVSYLTTKYMLIPYLQNQQKIIRILNPYANREEHKLIRSEQSVTLYKNYNYKPMQLWTLISLAPHSYLMSIFAMVDRIDLYFWVRLVLMNSLFVIAIFWQRYASFQTVAALNALKPAS